MQKVAHCIATMTAGTSHSEGPSGSGGSCSNSGLDLAQRGAETPHLAGTSHSEGPCSDTDHSAGTSHSEGPGPRTASCVVAVFKKSFVSCGSLKETCFMC